VVLSANHPLPRLRWLAILWLAVYLPAYTAAYGVGNFFFLCNLGVFLTAAAVIYPSPLLLSSQAVAAMAICLMWMIDAGGRVALGHHPFGFTAYMWDPQYPLFTRLLSTYHVAWPLLLVYCLRRLGYDPRGLGLQILIAAIVIPLSRLGGPEVNMNYAFLDPIFGWSWGPAPVHLASMVVGVTLAAYLPTHLTLRWLSARWPVAATAPRTTELPIET
jgi:hypothetical protein